MQYNFYHDYFAVRPRSQHCKFACRSFVTHCLPTAITMRVIQSISSLAAITHHGRRIRSMCFFLLNIWCWIVRRLLLSPISLSRVTTTTTVKTTRPGVLLLLLHLKFAGFAVSLGRHHISLRASILVAGASSIADTTLDCRWSHSLSDPLTWCTCECEYVSGESFDICSRDWTDST